MYREICNDDYDELSSKHDIIINLTYENPNLFKHFYDLKYEYCMLLNIKRNEVFNKSFTIIYCEYFSLYDACNFDMTISSVIHTPFLKNYYLNLFIGSVDSLTYIYILVNH